MFSQAIGIQDLPEMVNKNKFHLHFFFFNLNFRKQRSICYILERPNFTLPFQNSILVKS